MKQIVYAKNNAYQLRSIFDVVKDLLTDANIKFHKNGMHIVSMDPEKVVVLKLFMDNFEEYRFEAEKPFYIGLYMQYFYKMLRNVGPNHVIELEVYEETPNTLKITITGPNNGSKTVVSIQSLDIPKEDLVFPSVTYQAVLEMPTSDLQKTIRDVSHASKKIKLSYADQDPCYLSIASTGETSVTSISYCLS